MQIEGLTTLQSRLSAKETANRLAAAIEAAGMTMFARVDHAAGAAEAGMQLRPTELFLFGSPKAGTPLMQMSQTLGIDLPLKALVHEDAAGHVWLSYNDPRWLAHRHGLGGAGGPSEVAMAGALNAVASQAVG